MERYISLQRENRFVDSKSDYLIDKRARNKSLAIHSKQNKLPNVLSKMLGKTIINATYQTKQLQGGTVGDVRFVTGIAETVDNEKLPYKDVYHGNDYY